MQTIPQGATLMNMPFIDWNPGGWLEKPPPSALAHNPIGNGIGYSQIYLETNIILLLLICSKVDNFLLYSQTFARMGNKHLFLMNVKIPDKEKCIRNINCNAFHT